MLARIRLSSAQASTKHHADVCVVTLHVWFCGQAVIPTTAWSCSLVASRSCSCTCTLVSAPCLLASCPCCLAALAALPFDDPCACLPPAASCLQDALAQEARETTRFRRIAMVACSVW